MFGEDNMKSALPATPSTIAHCRQRNTGANGLTFIPPFDDLPYYRGQGTLALRYWKTSPLLIIFLCRLVAVA